MEFEYDPDKSASNKLKHGIDFEEAKEIWLDYDLAEIDFDSSAECRFAVIGLVDEKYWTAICTIRNERIRIISVRRSREKEIAIYDKGE